MKSKTILIILCMINLSVAAGNFHEINWEDTIEHLETEKIFERLISIEEDDIDRSDYGIKYYKESNENFNFSSINKKFYHNKKNNNNYKH